jgi:hypothetical protein
MPINFFDSSCKDSSNKEKFGLCDDPPPAQERAYIDEINRSKWIAIVNNPKKAEVEFFAIDNCVDILKPNGTMGSRCDGLLFYDKNRLIFVELKSREGGQWLKKGREQLTKTIEKFKAEYDITPYHVEAYVCNSLRPLAHIGQAVNIQKFKNDTGFILNGKQEINL